MSQRQNKYNPILETQNRHSIVDSYYDRNPRSFESAQIKFATKKWRKLGRYRSCMWLDEFESMARCIVGAMGDRWYW